MQVLKRNEDGKPIEVELTFREQSLQVLFNNRLDAGMSIEDAVEDLFRKFPSIMKQQSVEFVEYLSS